MTFVGCAPGGASFRTRLRVAIELWVHGYSRGRFMLSSGRPEANEVEDLCQVKQQRDAGHPEHEEDEDGLLRGPRHVALNSERTGGPGALN